MNTVTRANRSATREAAQTASDAPKKAGRAAAQNSGSRQVWESAPSAKKPGARLDEAVRSAISKAGFGFLPSLAKVSEVKLPKKVAEALEAFAGENGASGGGCSVGTLKIGKERVYVLSGSNTNNEVVLAAVDAKGTELVRAQITADKQYRLTMKLVEAGRPGTTLCEMQYDKKGDITDTDGIAEAKAALEKTFETGDDFGKDAEGTKLPPAVAAQYDFMERRASDSTGVRTFEIAGKKAYLLCDFSSVSSYYAVAPNGRLLFDAET